MSCTTKNPCSCIGKVKPSCKKVDPCPKGECCLQFCDHILDPKDAVGPCGQTGYLNVDEFKSDISCCADAVTYTIYNYDKKLLKGADISLDGRLEWTTGTKETVGEYAQVQIKACCTSNMTGHTLTKIFCIQIGIKDECECSACPRPDCDPCTGRCNGQVEKEASSSIVPIKLPKESDLGVTVTL